MGRESYIESAVPEATESPVYLDGRQIARGLGRHLTESFVGQITGGGGAGGTLEEVPFEPMLIEVINEAGATPTWHKFVMLDTPIGVTVAAAAADGTANAPTVTGSDNDFDVALNATVAPNGETVTVICYGVREVGGSL